MASDSIGSEAATQADFKYLRIDVKDSGIGITEEDQKKLFVPFTLLENSRKLNPNGSGLGLSICKSVLEKLDSKIWVAESRTIPDENGWTGTVMAFTIKVYKPDPFS